MVLLLIHLALYLIIEPKVKELSSGILRRCRCDHTDCLILTLISPTRELCFIIHLLRLLRSWLLSLRSTILWLCKTDSEFTPTGSIRIVFRITQSMVLRRVLWWWDWITSSFILFISDHWSPIDSWMSGGVVRIFLLPTRFIWSGLIEILVHPIGNLTKLLHGEVGHHIGCLRLGGSWNSDLIICISLWWLVIFWFRLWSWSWLHFILTDIKESGTFEWFHIIWHIPFTCGNLWRLLIDLWFMGGLTIGWFSLLRLRIEWLSALCVPRTAHERGCVYTTILSRSKVAVVNHLIPLLFNLLLERNGWVPMNVRVIRWLVALPVTWTRVLSLRNLLHML